MISVKKMREIEHKAKEIEVSEGIMMENAGGNVARILNGKIGLPGGLLKSGESAQCAAFRETWEETGLQLQPVELLQVFSKDFHLYRCDHVEQAQNIDPPLTFEVIDSFYLPPGNLDDYEWRFEEERDVVRALVAEIDPGSNISF